MDERRRGLLVGVDGSECADTALDWAAAEAAKRGGRLTVACVLRAAPAAEIPVPASVRDLRERGVADVLHAAAERARRTAAGLDVHTVQLDGDPAEELIGLAAEADEVVLGSRGHGGFATLALGSVTSHVAAHAHCSVVVVRGRPHGGGPVVIGVDGSQRGEDALAYGFDFADRHGLPVVAMHLYRLSLPVGGPYPALLDDLAAIQRSADQLTAEAVRRWSAKYPDVVSRADADVGSAAHDLAEASRTASLVVVGSRGHSGIAGLLLGSVGQALLRHADCPVVIAR